MEKIKVTIIGVRVYDQKEIPSVELQLAQSIKGYAARVENKVVIGYDETDVTSISMNRSQLTRELCAVNDLIDEYRGCRPNAFDQKAFALILRGAVLTIIREAHAAGEIVPDTKDKDGNEIAFKRDCYTTHIESVQLTDRAIARLDAACTLD